MSFPRRVVIDPLAAWSILDHHQRRKDSLIPDRVSGYLLGSTVNNEVEVRGIVPGLIAEFAELTRRSCPNDMGVGWYVTLSTPDDILTQASVEVSLERAVYLVVSLPTKARPTVTFRAFETTRLTLPSKELATASTASTISDMDATAAAMDETRACFRELECVVQVTDPVCGNVAIDALSALTFPEVAHASDPGSLPATAPHDDITAELEQLQANVAAVISYCDDVIAGREQPNKDVGRALSSVFAASRLASEVSAALVEERLQDTLMVMYISKLLRDQVSQLRSHIVVRRP